ncbi:MAG TPA: hypothetical protein DCZ12_12095 [Gammaproteobacteria bacterium]|nr:hypothetical protein [Gammaproteobacteria bacterium]
MNFCSELTSQLGFHCSAVRSPKGEDMTYISTPFTLAHGKPLDLFLIDSGDHVCITDDGFTIAEMIASGINLTDRRTWRGLSEVASAHGIVMDEQGAFTATVSQDQAGRKLQAMLSVFAGVCEWERERIRTRDADLTFYMAVEEKLRTINADLAIERNVSRSFGDQSYDFDFQWGATLVDTVIPHHSAVNAKLRKIIEISIACDENPDVLFIIDDSDGYSKAKKECQILGAHSRAVLFSEFGHRAA